VQLAGDVYLTQLHIGIDIGFLCQFNGVWQFGGWSR
jgi:hypothetical protein